MTLPRIALRDRKVILLSGFKPSTQSKLDTQGRLDTKGKVEDSLCDAIVVAAKKKLLQAAQRNPDACAFGYVRGEWVASA